MNNWEWIKGGKAAFATPEGSLFVDDPNTLVVFGRDSGGRYVKVELSMPPGVRVIVDPDSWKERGFAAGQ